MRIQPTYEELKRLEDTRDAIAEAGIQPTYEELKRQFWYSLLIMRVYPAYL